MSDEIRPGDRFERVLGGEVLTAKKRSGAFHDSWQVEEKPPTYWYCLGSAADYRRLPREPEEQPVSEPYKLPLAIRADGSVVDAAGAVASALAETARSMAANSLEEQVPIGSRWRGNQSGSAYTYDGIQCIYDSGRVSTRTRDRVLANSTRIDEPAKGPVFGGPAQKAFYDSREPPKGEANVCRGHSSCLLPGGHDGLHETNDKPATPPARCAPGCTPANACRTPDVCPAYAEDRVYSEMLRTCGLVTRYADQREAREWRSHRYEPATNGLGGMVGRYRYSR